MRLLIIPLIFFTYFIISICFDHVFVLEDYIIYVNRGYHAKISCILLILSLILLVFPCINRDYYNLLVEYNKALIYPNHPLLHDINSIILTHRKMAVNKYYGYLFDKRISKLKLLIYE